MNELFWGFILHFFLRSTNTIMEKRVAEGGGLIIASMIEMDDFGMDGKGKKVPRGVMICQPMIRYILG
jgi:hypothetical protein